MTRKGVGVVIACRNDHSRVEEHAGEPGLLPFEGHFLHNVRRGWMFVGEPEGDRGNSHGTVG